MRYLLITLVFLSSFAHSDPLLWKASKNGLVINLLGSVHVGTKELFPLPKEIMKHWEASDSLIVEVDLSASTTPSIPQQVVSTNEVLNHDQRQLLSSIAKELNISESQLTNSAPWSTALTIQLMQLNSLGYQPEFGIDSYFLNLAKQQEKKVEGLETTQFQLNLLASLPNGGEELLKSALDEWYSTISIMSCMLESWRLGDKQKLEEFAHISDMSPIMYDKFIRQRNQAWAQHLDQTASSSTKQVKFMVVGTLHLIGKDNLLSMLEEQGFSVELISNSQQANCSFDS